MASAATAAPSAETGQRKVAGLRELAESDALLIRSIRDELVEVVPGAYLGKMLWRHDAERHTLLAYFALRQARRSRAS